MQNPSAGWHQAWHEARFREDEGENMMAVAAMMLVFVVVVIHAAVRGVVIGMPCIVVVMVVGVYAQGGHVLSHVSMQRSSRRPGKLERNDEHDDQGDEAAHAGDCTALDVFTKGALRILPCQHEKEPCVKTAILRALFIGLVAPAVRAAPDVPAVEAYKSPTCGGCSKWMTTSRPMGSPSEAALKPGDTVRFLSDRVNGVFTVTQFETVK
jgi:hypothetical protein